MEKKTLAVPIAAFAHDLFGRSAVKDDLDAKETGNEAAAIGFAKNVDALIAGIHGSA